MARQQRIFFGVLAGALVVVGYFEFAFGAATQFLCESGCVPDGASNALIGAAALVGLLAWGSAAALIASVVRASPRHLRLARTLFFANLGGIIAWYGLALVIYDLTDATW